MIWKINSSLAKTCFLKWCPHHMELKDQMTLMGVGDHIFEAIRLTR